MKNFVFQQTVVRIYYIPKFPVLVQLLLHFSNSLSLTIGKDINLLFSSLSPSLTLNVSTHPLILGNIKTNGLITLAKYPIKYLELFFVSANYEMNILTSTSQISFFFFFFCTIKFFFCYFCLIKSQHYNTIRKFFLIVF